MASGQIIRPTRTQNYTDASIRASQTPTGNVRIPTSGNGLSTRGTILNDAALEECTVGPPRIDWQLIRKIALGGVKGDIPLNFSFPITKMWVASKDHGHLTDTLYFHFTPLKKLYPAGNAIDADGSEQWFDMTLWPQGNLSFSGKVLHFSRPILGGYLDIGQEAGGGDYNIMFAGSNEVLDIQGFNAGVTS